MQARIKGTLFAGLLVFLFAGSDSSSSSNPVQSQMKGSGQEVKIMSPPRLTFLGADRFHFEFFTNDVCSHHFFEVFEKDSNEKVGSFTGEEGCWGPHHGGFPQAEGYFGGFILEPSTEYRVDISIVGVEEAPPEGGKLKTGMGSEEISFDVVTTPE